MDRGASALRWLLAIFPPVLLIGICVTLMRVPQVAPPEPAMQQETPRSPPSPPKPKELKCEPWEEVPS